MHTILSYYNEKSHVNIGEKQRKHINYKRSFVSKRSGKLTDIIGYLNNLTISLQGT